MADLNTLIARTRSTALRQKAEQKVFFAIHTLVSERIFAHGLTAQGSKIGVYSKAYQAQRKRGVVYSPKRNVSFPISTNVILQATQQMKNDFTLITLPNNGGFGSGFKNNLNYRKSLWVENTYNLKDKIFALKKNEQAKMTALLNKEIEKLLNGGSI